MSGNPLQKATDPGSEVCPQLRPLRSAQERELLRRIARYGFRRIRRQQVPKASLSAYSENQFSVGGKHWLQKDRDRGRVMAQFGDPAIQMCVPRRQLLFS